MRLSVKTAAVVLVFFTSQPCAGEPENKPSVEKIIGRPTVIDGDTLRIREMRIRIHGIDALGSEQFCSRNGETVRCGQKSALALDEFLGIQNISCLNLGKDRYGRVIGKCTLGDIDIGGWLVQNGWAIAYRRYSLDYVDEEDEAHRELRGLWGMEFIEPEEYRKKQ